MDYSAILRKMKREFIKGYAKRYKEAIKNLFSDAELAELKKKYPADPNKKIDFTEFKPHPFKHF